MLASNHARTYPCVIVKQPFINVEEKIDRFVGRRTKTPDALSVKTSNKADAIAWRKAFGGVHVPKGYIYFAMAFSVGVEMLNIRMRKKVVRPVELREPYVREFSQD